MHKIKYSLLILFLIITIYINILYDKKKFDDKLLYHRVSNFPKFLRVLCADSAQEHNASPVLSIILFLSRLAF